jgi:hypothetical protein
MNLQARLTGISYDDGVLVVGIAEGPELNGWQLVFQRADEFDDQDRALGMDTYCIVSGWQEGTIYGGVESWAVDRSELTFRFSDDAARELHLAKTVRIALERDPAEVAEVVRALERVLGRSG